MKLSLVLFLTVAICASVSYAYPEPQPDPLADALAEAFAEPGVAWDKIKKFIGKIYDKLCKEETGNNKCKEWLKENITADNFWKFLAQFAEDIKCYCKYSESLIVRGGCALYRKFMEKRTE